jgi:hypothetical protein
MTFFAASKNFLFLEALHQELVMRGGARANSRGCACLVYVDFYYKGVNMMKIWMLLLFFYNFVGADAPTVHCIDHAFRCAQLIEEVYPTFHGSIGPPSPTNPCGP